MSVKPSLLVVNYVMDTKNSLLSHQIEAVRSLAMQFSQITVITGNIGDVRLSKNVKVLESRWIPGKPIANIFRLYRVSIPVIIKGRFDSVFFHMTDLHCAILSPIIRIRGKKQILWYAHTKNSHYLRWATFWVDQVVTSTEGSCPINGKKIVAIGQAIDSNYFREIPFDQLDLDKLVHIGRFDKSKNIDILIEQASLIRGEFKNLSLAIIGSPANRESEAWSRNLISISQVYASEGWLTFSNSIPRQEIPAKFKTYGCFFHAYLGSLDKTLIEATMLGLPVVTVNAEYRSFFGSWSEVSCPSLTDEYRALRMLSEEDIASELRRRRAVAVQNHSLSNWGRQLGQILK